MPDAGTVTLSEITHTSLKRIAFTWVSSAGGAADKQSVNSFVGQMVRAVQVPDNGGTLPTDLYDVTVLDDDGADALTGLGANISNAAVSAKVEKRWSGGGGE